MTLNPDNAGAPKLVVLVDPDANHARTMEKILRREGYRVLAVRQGREAIRILSGEPVHAVLCELTIPDYSAEVFLDSSQTVSPDTRVIFTCGDFNLRRRQRLLDRGAADCTSLPIDLDRLKALLNGSRNAANGRNGSNGNGA